MSALPALALAAALLVTPFALADPEPLVGVACGPFASADGTESFGCAVGSAFVECAACGPFNAAAWQMLRTVVGACEAVDAAAPTNLADSDAATMTADCGVHGTGVDGPVDPSAAKIVICWYDQWGYWNCIVVEGQGPGMATL